MNPILVFALRLLLILLAYTFIGWLVYLIFTDLRKNAGKTGAMPVPPISLTAAVDDEPDSRQFSMPPLTIGRDPASEYCLDHPTISLRHCRLTFHHKQWWAEDLESTNGSYLNNNQIVSPAVITDGDELRLGEILIKININ